MSHKVRILGRRAPKSRVEDDPTSKNVKFVNHFCLVFATHSCVERVRDSSTSCTLRLSRGRSDVQECGLRDSSICEIRDSFVCRVRESHPGRAPLGQEEDPTSKNVKFINHSCLEFVTHSCVESSWRIHIVHHKEN